MKLLPTIWLIGLCGCASTPVTRPAAPVVVTNQPPAVPGMAQMQLSVVASAPITRTLAQWFTLPIGWDAYTNDATLLAVQGSDYLGETWTNEATYSPPSLTNQFTASYSTPQHFLRLMVQ